MTTTFDDINRRVDERRELAGEPDKLLNKVYRQNDKQSSCISTDDHQSKVDDDPFGGKVEDSLRKRPTEWDGLQLAGGKIERPENAQPIDPPPNKFTHLKRCIDEDHVGDRWVNRAQFGHDARHSDKLKSICKVCEARKRRMAYIPRWKRGT
jgi:hypothetical protein